MKHVISVLLVLAMALAGCSPLSSGAGNVQRETLPAETFSDPLPTETPPPAGLEVEKLYRQVLDDLWEVDTGLNHGIRYIAIDLSGLSHLPEDLRHDLARQFADAHGAELLEDTWEDLCNQGYIDRENLLWEDGLYFEIKTCEDAAWNLPNQGDGDQPPQLSAFNAHKWRSGLGAYFFINCTAEKQPDGSWTYSVAQEAIA